MCVQVFDQRWRAGGHDVTHPRPTRDALPSLARQSRQGQPPQDAAGGGGLPRRVPARGVGGRGVPPQTPWLRRWRRSTRRTRTRTRTRSRARTRAMTRSTARRPRTREARRRVSTSEVPRSSLHTHYLRVGHCFALYRPSK